MLTRVVLILSFLLFAGVAQAAPPEGLTPCTVTPAALSVSNSSSNVHLSTCGQTLIIFNNGSTDAYIKLGTASNTAATTSDNLVPQKTFLVLNVGSAGLYLAAITAASTTTLNFIQGQAGN